MEPPSAMAASTDCARRANAYHALARALEPPLEWQSELAASLDGVFESFAPGLPELGAHLTDLAAAVADDPESVAPAHAKLFIGPFEIQVAPYASFYLDPEQRLMGPATQYAAHAYAEAELAPREGPHDAPDHVTHELEFMYFLAFQESVTADEVWRRRQERFWIEHLGLWLPNLASGLVRANSHAFYRVLGSVMTEFCVLEDALLNQG